MTQTVRPKLEGRQTEVETRITWSSIVSNIT